MIIKDNVQLLDIANVSDCQCRLVSRGQTTNFLQGVIACSISAHKILTGAYTASDNAL